MKDTKEHLMTPKEVGEFLGVAHQTVYRWAWKGDIPAIFVQRRQRKAVIRFRPSELEKWLDERSFDKTSSE